MPKAWFVFAVLLPLLCFSQADRPVTLRIDHIPIAVKDIDAVKRLLKDTLGFTIKEGRHHEGIYNCFTKFENGSYLEFVTPEDTSYAIGKFYYNFLQVRQGATAIAIAVNNAANTAAWLQRHNIDCKKSVNPVWTTVELTDSFPSLFFIEYADKNWKDTKQNTTHINTAEKLATAWYAVDDIHAAEAAFAKLGIITIQRNFMQSVIVDAVVGSNKLRLIRSFEKKEGVYNFVHQYERGIYGVTIRVHDIMPIKPCWLKTIFSLLMYTPKLLACF
ncbi:MAG TPA: VOC family protein [Chitinophagaceae bacterium]|nr:VOC family protein [Chitinophagaceae bacterium]